jgi:hypothetical protein
MFAYVIIVLNLFNQTESLYPHQTPLFVSPNHLIWSWFGGGSSGGDDEGDCEIFNTDEELEALNNRPQPAPTPEPTPEPIPEHKKDDDEGDCEIFFIP